MELFVNCSAKFIIRRSVSYVQRVTVGLCGDGRTLFQIKRTPIVPSRWLICIPRRVLGLHVANFLCQNQLCVTKEYIWPRAIHILWRYSVRQRTAVKVVVIELGNSAKHSTRLKLVVSN